MGPFLIIGGAVLLLLAFRDRSGSTTTQSATSASPQKGSSSGGPPNGVYPGAGMTLARAQEILIARGYDLGATGADGSYGPKTRAALVAFQSKNGLSAHGYLDTQTATMLKASVATSEPTKPAGSYTDVAGDDEARGCVAGKKDAVATIVAYHTMTVGVPTPIYSSWVEHESGDWKRGYKRCFGSTLDSEGLVLKTNVFGSVYVDTK